MTSMYTWVFKWSFVWATTFWNGMKKKGNKRKKQREIHCYCVYHNFTAN